MRYNTGNPVGTDGSSDPRDLYDNSGVIDVWATDRAKITAPDRLGVERRTLYGLEQQVNEWLESHGYEPVPLNYVDGSALTVARPTQLIERDGFLYSVKLPATFPVGLTGDWSSDQSLLVMQVDRSLRDELAASEGGGLVGYKSRTVAARLDEVINPKDYGAIADGGTHPLSDFFFADLAAAQAVYPSAISLSDEIDLVATQKALDQPGTRVHAPRGHYIFNRTLTRTTDIVLTGDGAGTVFDFSSGAGQLLITGSLSSLPKLATSPSRHTRELNIPAHGLSARDVIILWNPTDFSWGGRRAEYRDGAMLRLHSITDADNVFTYDPCPDAYVAASMNVYKMNYISADVSGITAIASNTNELAPMVLRHCVDSAVSNYSYYGGIYAGLQVDRCYNVDVHASSPINASPFVNNEYGTAVSNSTHVTVHGKGMYATRHAVSVGGTGLEATPPNRYVRISNMSVLGGSAQTNSADAHGNSDHTTYDNCFILCGGAIGGRNPTLRGCTIFGETGGAFAGRKGLYTAECNGGTVTIENCVIDTTGDGNTQGHIHFTLLGPGEDEPLGTGLKSDFNLIIRNVTILAPNTVANGKAVRVLSRNANKNVNITIDGLTVVAPTLLAFVYCEETVLATVPGQFMIVDNVYGPSGAYMIYPVATIASRATREMRQSGSQDISTVASQTTILAATDATFRYPYSRLPKLVLGVSTAAGTSLSAGAQRPLPTAETLTRSAVKTAITSATGTFSTTQALRVHWEASISDV